MSNFRIKNWDEYQHYKQRNPPWIKLHIQLLTSRDWVIWDDQSRVLAVACMLIASKSDGEIPNDPAFIQRVAYLNQPPNFAPLLECGFLISDEALSYESKTETETDVLADASTMLAVEKSGKKSNAEKEIAKKVKVDAQEILKYLNRKIGRRFSRTAEIEKCLKREKCSAEDCRKVIAFKASEWTGTEMEKYLNPSTLFRPSKFAGYLDEAQAGPVGKAKLGGEVDEFGKAVPKWKLEMEKGFKKMERGES